MDDYSTQPSSALSAQPVVFAERGPAAVFALVAHPGVFADRGATAVLALAPDPVVLADGRAPAQLARAPQFVVLAVPAYAPYMHRSVVCDTDVTTLSDEMRHWGCFILPKSEYFIV